MNQIDFGFHQSVLERVAKSFGEETDEYQAVLMASEALAFVQSREARAEFLAYLRSMKDGLSTEQRKFLNSIGLTDEELDS